jgi:hypothetical protein
LGVIFTPPNGDLLWKRALVTVCDVTTVTVPDLNYSATFTHTLNGNQSVTEDVTVPLPFSGDQESYGYHVSTMYLYGNTLIAQSSADDVLTVQSWWAWLWVGTVVGLALTFIGICVGAYKIRVRKRNNKLKLQKMQQVIRQQNHALQNRS